MIVLRHAHGAGLQRQAALLTHSLHAVKASVEGLTVTPTTVTVVGAEEADRTILQAAVEAFDLTAADEARYQWQQRLLAERAKQPGLMTLPERVRRIEICLGLD